MVCEWDEADHYQNPEYPSTFGTTLTHAIQLIHGQTDVVLRRRLRQETTSPIAQRAGEHLDNVVTTSLLS